MQDATFSTPTVAVSADPYSEYLAPVLLPAVGDFVLVQWRDGYRHFGEVTDHAQDGSGFEVGAVFADVSDCTWRVSS